MDAKTEPRPPGTPAAGAALLVGLAYAGVSVYWGVGGTALLSTVGGSIEQQARAGGATAMIVIWSAVVLKAVAATLPWVLLRHDRAGRWYRWVRALTWTAGLVLTGYGLLLTGAGVLVKTGLIDAAGADHRALTWHTALWDPWFLVWGLLVLAMLLPTRSVRPGVRPVRPGTRPRPGSG